MTCGPADPDAGLPPGLGIEFIPANPAITVVTRFPLPNEVQFIITIPIGTYSVVYYEDQMQYRGPVVHFMYTIMDIGPGLPDAGFAGICFQLDGGVSWLPNPEGGVIFQFPDGGGC